MNQGNNQLAKWLQMFDSMGMAGPSADRNGIRYDMSEVPSRRFAWAKQQWQDEQNMDNNRMKAMPPNFFGGQYGAGQGQQSDYAYTPPVKNWLTRLGG